MKMQQKKNIRNSPSIIQKLKQGQKPKQNIFIQLVNTISFCLIVIFLIFILAFYFYQSAIIYHPIIYDYPNYPQLPEDNPQGLRSPNDVNIPYENIVIKTEDNITLKGWFMRQNNPEKHPTVIFFHENAGNLGTRLEYFKSYYHLVKSNIICVAYRGYSESDQVSINQSGIEKDVKAIIEKIFQGDSLQIDKNQIFIHGRSLGGAASIYAVQYQQNLGSSYKIKGLILENTFTRIKDVAQHLFPLPDICFDFLSLLLYNQWNSIDIIDQIKARMLFIKSKKDMLVPYQQMDELQKKVKIKNKSTKEFIIENGGHNDNWTIDEEQYFSEILKFINESLMQL